MSEIGSLAEWSSAAAAIGALIAATWAVIVSRQIHALETDRDDRAADYSRRRQASSVTAWSVGREHPDITMRQGIFLHNSSDSPVFDVKLTSIYSTSKGGTPVKLPTLKLTVLPPGDFVVFRHTEYPWGLPVAPEAEKATVTPVWNNPGWKVTAFSFTDAAGIRWDRAGNSLEQQRSKPCRRSATLLTAQGCHGSALALAQLVALHRNTLGGSGVAARGSMFSMRF